MNRYINITKCSQQQMNKLQILSLHVAAQAQRALLGMVGLVDVLGPPVTPQTQGYPFS